MQNNASANRKPFQFEALLAPLELSWSLPDAYYVNICVILDLQHRNHHGQTVLKSQELQASGSVKFDHNNMYFISML